MAQVTLFAPRYKELSLKNFPDKLLEVDLDEVEVKELIKISPDLQFILGIKGGLEVEGYDIKLEGHIKIKYFKK